MCITSELVKNPVMRKYLIPLFAALLSLPSTAQQKQDILNYIEKYKQCAIDEMVRSKVPASITLAQGILESQAGTSVLSRNSNNHFGIKCKDEWTGAKYYHDDDRPQECFRVYKSVSESYADHSDFLLTRPRYAPLFELPITSYKYWAFGLKEAGYATNPKYASLLINYIEDYKLQECDQTGVAMLEEKQKLITQPIKMEPVTARVSSKVVVTEGVTKEHHRAFGDDVKPAAAAREELQVNGLRAVRAEANEDPFKIAFEFNIDYSNVMAYNDMVTGDRFREGEYVFLQSKRSRGSEPTYTVKTGESMRDIAQKTGVKMHDLYVRNQMEMNDQPRTGESLALQSRRNGPPATMSYAEYLKAQTKNTASTQTQKAPVNASASTGNDVPNLTEGAITNTAQYQVQKTDTLYSIAKKFNTSVEQLKEINNLETSDLKPGQTLVVAK